MNSTEFLPVDSPFHPVSAEDRLLNGDLAVAFLDKSPVSPGHTLVVPKRIVASLFELPAEERRAVWETVDRARRTLIDSHAPDGFNIGLNDGEAAGQTIPHVHVHVIPRYRGDCEDPRGGVRWILPEKAKYWEKTQ